MPLYEYRCDDCDHRFEVLQRLGGTGTGVAVGAVDLAETDKLFTPRNDLFDDRRPDQYRL